MSEVETYDISRPGTAGSDATHTTRVRADSKGSALEKTVDDDLLKVQLKGGEGESAIPEDQKVNAARSFRAYQCDNSRLAIIRKIYWRTRRTIGRMTRAILVIGLLERNGQ